MNRYRGIAINSKSPVKGSNQFQREYIEYLEKCNTELLNRFNNMKQSYENRILSNDLNKDYLISTLEDVLNIFTIIPQEVDLFFDKINAAMGAFQKILLRKSQMLQMMDKITKVLNSAENFNKLLPVDDSVLMKNEFEEPRFSKKAGTVKVSPMINGHIISTEPRIYLSRVPGVFSSRRSDTHQLSPIIEASPETSADPSNMGCYILKEIKIPLERINLNKMSYNHVSEESPKTRFKGPKLWKKSLSSNKRQSDYQRKSIFSENNENFNKKMSVGEGEPHQKADNADPLEGPSWLYAEHSEIASSLFVDHRRRKHRFATVFNKGEDCCEYVENKRKKSLRQDANKFYENHDGGNDEDFEEISKRFSESSEDFICTSLPNESDENYSPLEKRQSKGRECTTEVSVNEPISNFEMGINHESAGSKCVKSNTPVSSGSSEPEESERKFFQRSIKNRKSRTQLKSLHDRMSPELSFEKMPSRSDYFEEEIHRSKRSQNAKRKSTSVTDNMENDVCVRDDYADEKKDSSKRSKTGSEGEKKKSKMSKSKSNSRSPVVHQRHEGRIKRKAAPTAPLIEPTLKAKLRRK